MRLHARTFIDAARKIAAGCGVVACLILAGYFDDVRCGAQVAPSSYAVQGTVLDALTHQPIARALVDARMDAALTDSEGRFELHLPGGMTQVIVRRPGYLAGSERAAWMHTLQVHENMPPVTFYLTPAAGIVGQVTLTSGEQADNLPLMLYRKQIFEGRAQWMMAGNTRTGSDGVFRFVELDAPGTYIACSEPSADNPVIPGQETVLSGYPGLCFPGGSDLNAAVTAPITLSPGQQAQLDISLPRQPFYPVSITIGGITNGAGLQIFDRSGLAVNTPLYRSEQSGTFKAALPNGSYYAETRTWGAQPLYGRISFTVAGAPLTGLTLILAPMQPIPVEVHQEFTATPQEGGVVTRLYGGNRGDEPRIGMSMRAADRPTEGEMGVNLHRPQGSSGGDLWEMEIPSQGSYWLQARISEPQAYISSMTSGNTDLFREPLVVGSGNSSLPIEVTLRNDAGWLECKVKDTLPSASPQPVPSDAEQAPVFVYAIPQSPNQLRIYQSVAEQSATGEVAAMRRRLMSVQQEALPPGSYLVVAFDKPTEIDLDDREAMAQFSAKGQMVTIEPGATTQLAVEPIRTDTLEAAQ